MPITKLQADQLNVTAGTNLATVGSSFIYEQDFYAQAIPDGLTTYNSGAGAGFSYSNTMVEGRPGFAYPSPGTSSGAFSGRAHICPIMDTGPTTGWTVDAGELDMTFIVQTASISQTGTEDFFDIFGLSNSFNDPNPNNSVAITRQQGVNSGNWIFRYRTTSNQVTINGSSGSATSTWFVLRFKISASIADKVTSYPFESPIAVPVFATIAVTSHPYSLPTKKYSSLLFFTMQKHLPGANNFISFLLVVDNLRSLKATSD